MPDTVLWSYHCFPKRKQTAQDDQEKRMERRTIKGESPVSENRLGMFDMNQSNTGSEKPCVKQGSPFPKTKYVL